MPIQKSQTKTREQPVVAASSELTDLTSNLKNLLAYQENEVQRKQLFNLKHVQYLKSRTYVLWVLCVLGVAIIFVSIIVAFSLGTLNIFREFSWSNPEPFATIAAIVASVSGALIGEIVWPSLSKYFLRKKDHVDMTELRKKEHVLYARIQANLQSTLGKHR